MDDKARVEVRDATQRLRRPPSEPLRIRIGFDSDGELSDDLVPAPLELTIEATNADGELAPWFDDFWWTDLIQRWGDDPLTVHIAPTPSALLHMVVLYQLEMLGRVAPRWRIIGHAYRDDVAYDEAIEFLARSPYHELRFLDQPRPGGATASCQCGTGILPVKTLRSDISLDELFGRIRREQSRLGLTGPILVRLPAHRAEPSPQVKNL